MTAIRFRLRTDFPLAIISLFGALAAVAFFPYAMYRFASGKPLHGIVDLVVVATITWAVTHAWRTGNTRVPGFILMVVATGACLTTAMLPGAVGVYWLYTALLANYLMVRPIEAAAMTAVSLLVLILFGNAFASSAQLVAFVISVILVSLFAFIFAYRAESHRQQWETLASMDPLTGTGNRRAMENELTIAIKTHQRDGTRFGLALLDLDHFKHINDDFGHEAGDRVLIELATLVRENTRQIDRLFRFGGEEFVLLVPGADSDTLRRVADKLCAVVAGRLRCRERPITVSIGASLLNPSDDANSWLARADAALYVAKNAGRNRVQLSADRYERRLTEA